MPPFALRHPRALLSTTRSGVEWLLVGAFLGFRLLNVIQALVSVPLVARSSQRPLDLSALAVLLIEIALVARIVVRRGRYDDPRLASIDVAVNIVVLASTVLFTDSGHRFNSWADWGYPVTMSAALGAGIAFSRLWQSLVAALALAATYLATELGGLHTFGDRVTAVNNSLTYLVFGGLAWVLATYLRRLAAEADLARADAARVAARLERAEHRNLLHDQASVLALLSQDDLDDRLVRAARAQAAAGSAQIRAFLAGRPAHSGRLGETLAGVAAEFTDLPLTANIALATADLPGPVCGAVAGAVRTLLHNVRRHAGASEVVLHAVTTGTEWEVTVTDDGDGFDPAVRAEGYGLSEQVRGTVAAIGGATVVESSPGHGTTVWLRGPLSNH